MSSIRTFKLPISDVVLGMTALGFTKLPPEPLGFIPVAVFCCLRCTKQEEGVRYRCKNEFCLTK